MIQGDIGIAILAKAPTPGRAKTRLIPALGADGAARLQDWLLRLTLEKVSLTGCGHVCLWWDGDIEHPALASYRSDYSVEVRSQPNAGLGERMRIAIASSTAAGGTLVIGTDSPPLSAAHLDDAARSLATHDAVVFPAEDGGYVLIGMRQAASEAFDDMTWGHRNVMAHTRERLQGLGWRWREPETLWDVDRPEDLPRLLDGWPEVAKIIR